MSSWVARWWPADGGLSGRDHLGVLIGLVGCEGDIQGAIIQQGYIGNVRNDIT